VIAKHIVNKDLVLLTGDSSSYKRTHQNDILWLFVIS